MNIHEASRILAYRYREILSALPDVHSDKPLDKTSYSNLVWMCQQIEAENQFPIDKLSRWLGFIQGVMAAKGLIDVDEERDFSRPLFHEAYSQANIEIPETSEMKPCY